ncbi:MAG: hypothetical protein L0Z07_07925 [Planctomycetes bacterium]|nr:hypothetical protein [Planctomycetota bacterium]
MKRMSLLAILAISLGANGCSCCRGWSTPQPLVAAPACPPPAVTQTYYPSCPPAATCSPCNTAPVTYGNYAPY